MIMVKIKNILLVILVSIFFIFSFNEVNASEITSVKAIDNQTIDVNVSNISSLADWEIAWDVKLLNDIQILSAKKDDANLKKVVVLLWDNKLIKNKSYSLLTVFGSEGSIDFDTKDNLIWVDVLNSEKTEWQNIDHIFIKDASTIEIYYKDNIAWTDFEYKLLSNIDIENITKRSNILVIKTKDILKSNSSYIVMLISIMDTNSKEVEFDDGIFDFSTWVLTSTNNTVTKKETVTENELPWDIDMWNEEEKELTVEHISLNAPESPDTWPETTVLLFLTFILSSFVFIRKKIFRK